MGKQYKKHWFRGEPEPVIDYLRKENAESQAEIARLRVAPQGVVDSFYRPNEWYHGKGDQLKHIEGIARAALEGPK